MVDTNRLKKRIIKNQNWFKFNQILIPINYHHSHWCLVEIRPQQRTIQLFDSFHPKEANDIFHKLKKFMINIAHTHQLSQTKWREILRHDIPKQTDDYNCGVFILEYARLCLDGRTINFPTQSKYIRYVRKRIKVELADWKMIRQTNEQSLEQRLVMILKKIKK